MVIHPIPKEDELLNIYDNNYFSNIKLIKTDLHGVYGYIDYIAERINKQAAYKTICKNILNYLGSNKKNTKPKFLDFGCGLGFLLDTAFDYGFSVHGIEFNKYAIDYINTRYRYEVKQFEDLDEFKQQFQIITMIDVIEHLEDPFSVLKNLTSKLSENGLLVILTMDSNSIVSRLLGKKLEDFRRINEHIYFFSKSNLLELLSSYGYEILETKYIGHTFELKYLFDRIKSISPSLSSLFSFIVKLFPFLGKLNIYINPYTKMIIYARKKH